MWVFTVGEHVVIQGEAFGLECFQNEVGDGGEVVRLDAQMAVIAMMGVGWFEPWLGDKGLGLPLR